MVCAIEGPSTSQRASLDCRECKLFAYELCLLLQTCTSGFWEAWRNHLTFVQARHGLSIADAFKVAFLLEQQASLTCFCPCRGSFRTLSLLHRWHSISTTLPRRLCPMETLRPRLFLCPHNPTQITTTQSCYLYMDKQSTFHTRC